MMGRIHTGNGRAVSLPAGLSGAVGISMVATVAASALGAYLVSIEWIAEQHIGIWSMGTLILSSVMGGMTAAQRIKRLRIQMALLNGMIYFLMLLCLTLLVFGGKITGMGTTLVLIGIGSVGGGMLSKHERGKGKGRRRKKLHC